MTILQLVVIITSAALTMAVHYPANPTSEMSADDNSTLKGNRTMEQSDESGHEIESDLEEKDKKFLDDAMKTILDPTSIVIQHDKTYSFKTKLEALETENITIDEFMDEMDKISLDVCKTSQAALWSYVTDINNESKKNSMVNIAAEEDEIKKQYWTLLKNKYLNDEKLLTDPKIKRRIRIIKERGTNVQMPQSKQREEIDTMQRIWSRVTVCEYNASDCTSEDSVRTISDVISVFKTSNDTKELAYYWKTYRDATGRKIRPIFKDYVLRMNKVAESENFTDAGDMWRYVFEDENFMETVQKLWTEIKPFYNKLHDYVRSKLKRYYGNYLQVNDHLIPAHLIGNLWAQEWQSIYSKVAPYPNHTRPRLLNEDSLHAKDLFNAVDDFHQSLGFESAKDSFEHIQETSIANCLPSSHDMCDGVHYKIKWCGEKVTDVVVGLSKAARLLGHVQYFKHYRNLPSLYRDGPNPAFHEALSDIVAVQLTTPAHLQILGIVTTDLSKEATTNHLLWVALEKFPLMAYAYALDKWRWDVFGNSGLEKWNQHWWDIRMSETGVSPPVPRNESDLDPAAKYHVVSHVQYITYLVSHVLEFQILQSLCKRANHTGPLHECSIYGDREAGKILSDGMSLGASEDWRTVLEVMTGERELSTSGILEYFSGLQDFLNKENYELSQAEDMNGSAPIIVGAVVIILTILIIILYCIRKHDLGGKILSLCGLSKNGSLDIVTNDMSQGKTSEVEGISEEKV